MKPRLPSPAMVVAMVALAVGLSGTAVAAVNFASNAGAVDGKSAVASGAKLSSAAGKLVATQRSGSGKGRIASQYLDLPQLVRGSSSNFGRAVGVVDNATGVAQPIGSVPGIGALTASCKDESPVAGRLDPADDDHARQHLRRGDQPDAQGRQRRRDGDRAAPTAPRTSSRSPARGRSRCTSSAAARTRSSRASCARTGATSRRRSAWSTGSRS